MTDLRGDLEAAMTIGHDVDIEDPAPWTIDDDGKATWALRKVAAAEREIADADRLYKAELARLQAWREQVTTAPKRTVDYMTVHLFEYLERLRWKTPNLHTVTLPGGTITHRTSQRVIVKDADAFMAWAEEHGYERAVKRTPLVSEIKSDLSKTDDGVLVPITVDGENVPGIECEVADNWGLDAAPIAE